MKKYINYEMNETHTKQGWFSWYNENGDKNNFLSFEDWFTENIRMQNLNEI